MISTPLPLAGLVLIEFPVHHDVRGFLTVRFQQERFAEFGLPTNFVQDTQVRSTPGVLRGLHFQSPGQGKLVSVVRGRIWDVAVDIRPDSPTFGRHFSIELADDGRSLWIPAGFAHGYCVLGNEPADVVYKVDAPYRPESEGGIHFADPELAISWPISAPTVSSRDSELPAFADVARGLRGHR